MFNPFKIGDIVKVKPEYLAIVGPWVAGRPLTIEHITTPRGEVLLWFDKNELSGGWFPQRFEPYIPTPTPAVDTHEGKREFSVRYAHTPKDTKRVVDRVVRRMKRKMPAWLFDGIVVAMLNEASDRIQQEGE